MARACTERAGRRRLQPYLMEGWGGDPVKPAAASVTWGKLPTIPEMLYHVKSQMFGMTTLTLADGSIVHMYNGEREELPDDAFIWRWLHVLGAAAI